MDSHKNARSSPWSRALLVERVENGWSVAAAAEAIGLSVRSARKWLRRAERGEGFTDRSSRPHRTRIISQQEQQAILELRRERLTCRQIAERVARSRATVARVVGRAGMSRLRSLDPPPPRIRYERAVPGELLHVDVKKLGRINGIGHRVTGRREGKAKRAGWEFVFVCVDDHSRASYVEIMDDERKDNAALFLCRAVEWFRDHGVVAQSVMTDNAWIFKSIPFRSECRRRCLRHLRTKPYTPRTNGKAERFIQTLLREWAYRFAYRSSAERTRWLKPYLHFYNRHRRHSSLGEQSPFLRLMRNNVLRHDN
jgi:transposase InsO family protein